MNSTRPKYHFYQMVKYKDELIPYLVIRVIDGKDSDKPKYAIIRIDKQTEFLLDKEKSFEEILNYGFKIKYEVKEEDLSTLF